MSALPLEYAVQPNPPARPSYRGTEVCKKAAELAFPEVVQWFQEEAGNEKEQQYILRDLEDAYDRADSTHDGYALASCLERKHFWQPDAELVEILGGGHCDQAYRELVKEWVMINKIKPSLRLFDRVLVRHRDIPGIICRILPETAEYGVHYKGESLSMYHIFAFEEVEKF